MWAHPAAVAMELRVAGGEKARLLPRGDPEAVLRASGVLAEAFADDPLWCAAVPDRAERAEALPELFYGIAAWLMPHRVGLVTGGGEAAALWEPPDAGDPTTVGLRACAAAVAGPKAADFLAQASEAITAAGAALSDGCYKLHWVGTLPRARGRGHARACIEPVLRAADDEGRPCFLESSSETNVPFYRSLGFTVEGSVTVPGAGGPDVLLLRREPKT